MPERTPVRSSVYMSITTAYVGATDTAGSAIVASVTGNNENATVTRGYDHALDVSGNHNAAAAALANHLKSHGRMPEDVYLVGGPCGDSRHTYVLMLPVL